MESKESLSYSVSLIFRVTCYGILGYLPTLSISSQVPPFMIVCSPALPLFRVLMLPTHKASSLCQAHPAHGGLFSALGFLPGTPLLLEACFNFNSHSYSCLPTSFGRWGSGRMKLEGLTNVHNQERWHIAVIPYWQGGGRAIQEFKFCYLESFSPAWDTQTKTIKTMLPFQRT